MTMNENQCYLKLYNFTILLWHNKTVYHFITLKHCIYSSLHNIPNNSIQNFCCMYVHLYISIIQCHIILRGKSKYFRAPTRAIWVTICVCLFVQRDSVTWRRILCLCLVILAEEYTDGFIQSEYKKILHAIYVKN